MEMIKERVVVNAISKTGVTSFVSVMFPKPGFSVSELTNKEGW